MKRGKLQKMVSVRDLLRNMRTHSVLAVGASVALATVLFGSIAANVLGTIEADASSIETNTLYLAEQVEAETRAIEAYVGELRERMSAVQDALDVMEQAVVSGQKAGETIERYLAEVASIDRAVKEAFAGVMREMVSVQGYIDTDREQTGNVLQKTRDVQTVTVEEKKTLETMEEQVGLSTDLVVRHYTVLSADVDAVTDRLRHQGVNTVPFTEAINTLKECFATGMRGVEQARGAFKSPQTGTDDVTTLMLARLQMTVGGVENLSDSVDASGEVVEALRGQVQTSTDTLLALQREIAQTSARLGELTAALDSVSGDIRSMQAQVSGAVQAGEAGREALARMGLEQRDAIDDALADQQKAWDEAASKQQDALDAGARKQQEALDAATGKQQEALDAATGKQQEALDAAAGKQQEMLDAATGKQQETLDAATGKQQETLDAATKAQRDALDAATADQRAALERAAADQNKALQQAAADQNKALQQAAAEQNKTLQQAAAEQNKTLEQAAGAGAKRGDNYVTVTFDFNIGEDATYTFDFSQYLSNYDAVSSKDILVRDFRVGTSGTALDHMGVSANINLDSASYDPATGHLVLTKKMLKTPLGGQKGTVVFAVIGGILK